MQSTCYLDAVVLGRFGQGALIGGGIQNDAVFNLMTVSENKLIDAIKARSYQWIVARMELKLLSFYRWISNPVYAVIEGGQGSFDYQRAE
ncbi:hypothetical protein Ancab_007539 [Ancistrocladus abbreviatus]